MRVESLFEQLFFTTVYIETTYGDGSMGVGTGFIYNVELDVDEPEPKFVGLVVTNKHVIKGADRAAIRFFAGKDDEAFEPLLGEAHTVTIPSPETLFTGHPNPDIDVTVASHVPWINELRNQGDNVFFRGITSSLAMNDENAQTLDALEEVTFIGYPNGLYDHVNYLPIARRGHTATPPSVDYGGQPMFLVDASVFPGSSGSPVLLVDSGMFTTRTGDVMAGHRMMLLGVMAAVYQRDVPVLQVPTGMGAVVEDAIDIGLVYKARAIDETADIVLAKYGLQRQTAPSAEPVTRPVVDEDALAEQ